MPGVGITRDLVAWMVVSGRDMAHDVSLRNLTAGEIQLLDQILDLYETVKSSSNVI